MKQKFVATLVFCIVSFCFALSGAKYLIITQDDFVQAVQPLADWKTKKGMKAKIVPLSICGSSASQIKSYILSAYNTWDIRPEYILLAGSGVPVSGSSDDYYADMTGNYRIELSVGRFPCSSANQINNIVSKTLQYERTPLIDDTTWFLGGTTIVREDNSSTSDPIYWENARFIHNLWAHVNYINIDSFSSQRGHSATHVNNAINNGRMFVVYRGQGVSNWWSPFAMTPATLNNGSKTPIIISGTCATMSLSSSSYLGNEFINAGSAVSPKGAVGFFGTTSVGSGIAAQRGVVTKGFFQALFGDGIQTMGDAAKRGKVFVDSLYPNQTRYQEWNLFGDPELNIWTGRPKILTVLHDTVIMLSPQTYNITVQSGLSAVPGALVCLMMDTTIYEHGYTNSAGMISFTISPTSTGLMSVTVTSHNCAPYEKDVIIRPGNLQHDVGVMSIIEPCGTIVSGVSVVPKVKIKNYGVSTDSFPVTLKIGTSYETTINTVILSPGDTTTLLFPSWTATGGTNPLLAYTLLSGDQWYGNDSVYGIVYVITPNDVGVDAILSPDSTHLINVLMIPKARVKNYGGLTQMNFAVTCSIIGASGGLRYTNTQNVTSLASDDTILINFNGWTPTVSERCTVKMRTNLIGDENSTNDAQVRITQITMLFLCEGFNQSFPPAGWQNIVVQGTYAWEGRSSNNYPTCSPYEGTAMASYESFSASSGSMARLISPPLTLGTAQVPCSLKFFMFHDPGYPGDLGPDSVKIEYTTNGINFNRVAAFERYGPTSGWFEHSVYLGAFTGTVYFSFLAFSQYGNNMNIDYIRLFSPSAISEEVKPINLVNLTILNAPRPNPVSNGFSQISFILSQPIKVALKIYDASGSLIKTLINAQLENGNYIFTWNGRNEQGQQVAKGIYFYTLETPVKNFTEKIIFIR